MSTEFDKVHDLSKVQDRIRKLLTLADDQVGLPEGDSARAFATRLANKHGLDLNELSGPAVRVPVLEVPLGGPSSEKYREQYRAAVLAVLAELAGCTSTYNPGRWIGKLYGDPEACQKVAEVYADLVRSMDPAFRRWWIPNRFGLIQKHSHKRQWWIEAALLVRTSSFEGPEWEDESIDLILRSPAVEADLRRMQEDSSTRTMKQKIKRAMPPDLIEKIRTLRNSR